jgi:hypothetical protein
VKADSFSSKFSLQTFHSLFLDISIHKVILETKEVTENSNIMEGLPLIRF